MTVKSTLVFKDCTIYFLSLIHIFALFGDLGVKDITKAHAIDALLEYLGADIEDTYAFGDAKIDIPMLDYCHIGVAMGSGGDEIKAMADYITDDVDQDGLYNAFVRFGLIEAE